jgi:hypothetical protein
MTTILDAVTAGEMKERLARLKPDSARMWGTMDAAQAAAHCSAALEMALGDLRPPRKLIGRFLGWMIKPLALREGDPMRRNTPTADALVVADERNLEFEKRRLGELMDRFTASPGSRTNHPHPFFGKLIPGEWEVLMHKHLDHHLRQFGV